MEDKECQGCCQCCSSGEMFEEAIAELFDIEEQEQEADDCSGQE